MPSPKFGVATGWIILIGCLSALIFFGYQTLQIRLETGDSLPEYSTYRADAKGLKALYDSISETDRISASRRLQTSLTLPSGNNRTLVFAGCSLAVPVSLEESKLLDHWLVTGGRLIVAFRAEDFKPQAVDGNTGSGDRPRQDSPVPISWQNIIQRWGANLNLINQSSKRAAISELFATPSKWFSRYAFHELAPEWRSIATLADQNVIVERAFGSGSIVLLSDSYPLSNESLATDRQTRFLIWLIGDRSGIVFDEIHLGIEEHAGIMTLAGRYGLQGALISFVAALLFFVWRCQYSLLPRKEPSAADMIVQGSSSEQTFLNLLQRSVPEKRLLQVCIETWIKTARPSANQLAIAKDFEITGAELTRAVEGYNKLTTLLHEKI